MLIVEQDREKFVPSPQSPHCPRHSGQAGGSLLQFIISCKKLVEVKIRNLITTGASFHFLLAQPSRSYQAHRRWQCNALQNGLQKLTTSSIICMLGMHGQCPPLCITPLFSRGLSIKCQSQREKCQNSVGHSEYPSSVLQAQARSQQVLLTHPDNWKLDIIYYKTIRRAEFQCNCKYYSFCTKANKYL